MENKVNICHNLRSQTYSLLLNVLSLSNFVTYKIKADSIPGVVYKQYQFSLKILRILEMKEKNSKNSQNEEKHMKSV